MNKEAIANARTELNRMAKVAKAFANAEAVVVLLENSAQLESEAAKAVADARAELATVKAEEVASVAAKKAAETATGVRKQASQDECEAMLKEAKAAASEVRRKSAVAVETAKAKETAAADELAALIAQKASVSGELTALNKQIEQAKAQVRKILQEA
tara:strand:- start:594 stop:1067 length:474 start_codon:yes stop_codon:yes gene_type:complete